MNSHAFIVSSLVALDESTNVSHFDMCGFHLLVTFRYCSTMFLLKMQKLCVRACVYFCFWEVAFDFEVFFPIFPEGKDKTPIKSSVENCSNHFS